MKFYKGDIVEIVTAKYNSWNDIPTHERIYFENQREPAPTIGQRFIVNGISKENKYYAMINNRLCLLTSYDCLCLYKRPIINHIKAFVDILKSLKNKLWN